MVKRRCLWNRGAIGRARRVTSLIDARSGGVFDGRWREDPVIGRDNRRS